MTTDSKASDVEAREREAFEIWAGWPKSRAPRKPNGEYHAERDELRWKAWLARASQQPSAQWITVSAQSPELHQRVLVVTEDADGDPFVDAAHWNGANIGFLGVNGRRLRNANLWQPIPAAPDTERTE